MPAAGFATRPAESGSVASGGRGDPGRLTAQEKVWMLTYQDRRVEKKQLESRSRRRTEREGEKDQREEGRTRK